MARRLTKLNTVDGVTGGTVVELGLDNCCSANLFMASIDGMSV